MMTSSLFLSTRSVALMAAMALACSASFADKPDGAGGGEGNGNGHGNKHAQKSGQGHGGNDKRHGEHGSHGKKSKQTPQSGAVKVGGYFGDQQRGVIHTYYGEQFKGGHCPRGLAKKNNGCMPPGQAKKYALGQPLPRNVIYYTLPPAVSVQLGVPPVGYKYVRVASDILLIALGTSMVVDAIQDLGGL